MKYYIETKKNANSITEARGKIEFPENASELDVFAEYMRLCHAGEYGWLCLRGFNGWLHCLISEFWKRDVFPFWYYAYPEYKEFAENLGFLPHKVSEK